MKLLTKLFIILLLNVSCTTRVIFTTNLGRLWRFGVSDNQIVKIEMVDMGKDTTIVYRVIYRSKK